MQEKGFKFPGTDLVVFHSVDGESGKRANEYYFKKRLCGRVELMSKLSQQLAGYYLIEKDLRNIIAWLDTIIAQLPTLYPDKKQPNGHHICERSDDVQLHKAILVAVLTFYGKLFTQAKGRRIKLNRSLIREPYLRNVHDQLVELRHTFAAHSGTGAAETACMVVVVDRVKRRQTDPWLVCELNQPSTLGEKDFRDFRNLAKFLYERVEEKMKKLYARILKEEVSSKGLEYWYQSTKDTPNKGMDIDKK